MLIKDGGLKRPEYIDDTRRILGVLNKNLHNATLIQAERLRELYSDSMSAGWLCLPENDDELYSCVSTYIY